MLRADRVARVIKSAISDSQSLSFSIVHYSIQDTHAHMIVEAADRQSLARGMIGLTTRIARRVNQALRVAQRATPHRRAQRQAAGDLVRSPLERPDVRWLGRADRSGAHLRVAGARPHHRDHTTHLAPRPLLEAPRSAPARRSPGSARRSPPRSWPRGDATKGAEFNRAATGESRTATRSIRRASSRRLLDLLDRGDRTDVAARLPAGALLLVDLQA